jgi:hypothetical protein
MVICFVSRNWQSLPLRHNARGSAVPIRSIAQFERQWVHFRRRTTPRNIPHARQSGLRAVIPFSPPMPHARIIQIAIGSIPALQSTFSDTKRPYLHRDNMPEPPVPALLMQFLRRLRRYKDILHIESAGYDRMQQRPFLSNAISRFFSSLSIVRKLRSWFQSYILAPLRYLHDITRGVIKCCLQKVGWSYRWSPP